MPPLPVAETGKRTERPHPLTPLIRGWLLLVAIVLAVGREFLPDGHRDGGFQRGDLRWLFIALGVAVLLAAAAGFVSWWFTHFVIDDDEIRVDSGALWRRSARVGFERLQSVDIVQPFAARPFGLVELRLEAGGGDRSLVLRYLRRAHADRLRGYLLARAHGEQRSVADDHGPVASGFTDLGADDRPLVTVSSARLIGSFLLSTEWLLSAGALVAMLVLGRWFAVLSFLVPSMIPVAIGTLTLVSRRVLAMFRFTLSESPHGLRVARGLTNLTSQSVPLDRVQGVRVTQSLLWRPFGWYRLDVDVLGYRSEREENNRSEATTVLLPVADRGQLAGALSRVLPGVDVDAVPLRRPPARARALRWLDFRVLRSGWDARVVVTDHGLLVWTRDIVPHGKAQSARIRQGPLQRLLRLADVHVDTTPGPVDAVARQLDVADARAMATGQLDRTRAALRTRPPRS
ncbi:PH domain-containing protein [Nakamurella deserti]|uniref:PH domain-containing protein n=1 Tax=Nakamurella deserti TaxID=2164074 RepID=UPI000DBE6545|nr:PH domain-containing protein [Nakamurella deserti]